MCNTERATHFARVERLNIDHQGPTEIIVVGEIDAQTAPAFADAIARLDPDARLNLRGCTFIDSAGISCLVDAQRACQQREGSLTLVAPSQPVIQLLNICGMNDLFNIEPLPDTV